MGHKAVAENKQDARFSDFVLKPINKHWYHLAKVLLNCGPVMLEKFKELIDTAQNQRDTDYEADRRKQLEAFMKAKRNRNHDFLDLME